jgi:DNA-binding LacI/PurR family transcriptional regulator
MKRKKQTMADVAALAAVSPTTVARVLYGNGYVSDDARRSVEAVIERIGYRPNLMARGLKTQQSFTIGLVLGDSRRNLFYSKVAHAVQEEGLRHAYTVVSISHNLSEDTEHSGLQRLTDQHVDALLFCPAYSPENVRRLIADNVPVVQIGRQIAKGGCLVTADSATGIEEAVRHLHALGHERIAFIGGQPGVDRAEGPLEQSVEQKRLDCIVDTMRGLGSSPNPDMFRLGPYSSPGLPQIGDLHMRELLSLPAPPTALIAGSDLLAAGALQAIYRAGLKVPEDISVIGFDDSIAEFLSPALTSIAQPVAEMGRLAFETALRAVRDPTERSRTVVLPTAMIHRESTATAKR